MKKEHDEYLVKKYPRLFRDRYKPMTETCMCWGFSHGDGWFNIIAALCGNIQHHIDWARKQRAHNLQYNRCLKRALNGDTAGLIWFYTYGKGGPSDWTHKQVAEAIASIKFREVPESVPQVVVDQVKEKFGTLRFYYHGGDATIDGMVRMAEAMSGYTCEHCGVPAETKSNRGWVSTICSKCRRAMNARRKKEMEEYEKSNVQTA